MIKLFIISLLLVKSLYANLLDEIYGTIFSSIFPNKNVIKIYNVGNENYKVKRVIYTKEIYNSDLIFVSDYYRLKIYANKPIFVSNVVQLKIYDNAIGGLFWEDGEMKIVLLKERLERFNLKVDERLGKYIVSKKVYSLW